MTERRQDCRELAGTAAFARPSARTALLAHGTSATLHADTWVFADELATVLLIQHPARGWVPPGGKVEPGESIVAGASRELSEETGVAIPPSHRRPASLTHSHDAATGEHSFTVSYAAIVDRDVPLRPEEGLDGLAWWSLDERWPSVYPSDRVRLRAWARSERMRRQQAARPGQPRRLRSSAWPV